MPAPALERLLFRFDDTVFHHPMQATPAALPAVPLCRAASRARYGPGGTRHLVVTCALAEALLAGAPGSTGSRHAAIDYVLITSLWRDLVAQNFQLPGSDNMLPGYVVELAEVARVQVAVFPLPCGSSRPGRPRKLISTAQLAALRYRGSWRLSGGLVDQRMSPRRLFPSRAPRPDCLLWAA